MTLASYGSNSNRRSGLRAGRASTGAAVVGIVLLCVFATGCSSRARPLSLAFGGVAFAPTPQGLSELLDKSQQLPVDERKTQLRSFVDSSAAEPLKEKAAYALARTLQMSSAPPDWKEAVDRYKQAGQLPALSERCAWHISECAAKDSDEKLAREWLQKLIVSTKDKEMRVRAIYTLGQSYMRTGDHENAKRTFSQLYTVAPDSQYALGSTYYLAEIDLSEATAAQKQTSGADGTVQTTASVSSNPATASATIDRAIAAFRHYLQASPDGHFATEIAAQLKSLPQFQPTVADHNLLARVYFANGDYQSALNEWRAAGNKTEWFKQATALIRLGKTAEGKTLLADGIKNHPSDESVVTAATMLCRLVNRQAAIAVWKGVLDHSPKFSDAAMYNLAARAPSDAVAIDFYQRIINSHPTSAFAPESAWWVAWNRVKAGRSQDALALLQSATIHYPDAKAASRFLYWTGKMHERLGAKEAAKAAYSRTISKAPWHYYAHRAEARIHALSGGRDPGWRTSPQRKVRWTQDSIDDWQFPEPPAELAAQEGPTLAMLTELKQWDECLELLPENRDLLRGFYLAKLNMPLEAINAAGKGLHGMPAANEGWQLAYPLLYAKFIAHESPIKHVDPLLVQALIREESRYNAQAVSSSHALGLMQLMPATAYGVAKRLGISIAGLNDIHRPENNMRMGIDYLSYVLRRFNGNALFAVASYNGGPNAVQRWSAAMPADTDVFVENIPFKETREYVRKVFGSYWNYEAVYGS